MKSYIAKMHSRLNTKIKSIAIRWYERQNVTLTFVFSPSLPH